MRNVRQRQPMSATWIVVIGAVVVLFFLNGTLSYIYRARQMRSEGKEPPSYLRYMFFPVSFYGRVPMPRSVRWPLGLIVFVGGLLFVLLGVALMLLVDPSKLAHPLLLLVPILIFAPLGAGIGYVGWRMLRMKNEDEPLLGITRKWREEPTDAAK